MVVDIAALLEKILPCFPLLILVLLEIMIYGFRYATKGKSKMHPLPKDLIPSQKKTQKTNSTCNPNCMP